MTRPDFSSGSEAFGRGAGRSGMSEGAAAAWEGETVGGGWWMKGALGAFG
jgi:hypothetical protein